MSIQEQRNPLGAALPSAPSRLYVLVMLTALSAFNHLDRQLIAIVLEPVRVEFSLSDVQLGLLSGLAFAALYTTLSIPAALWAMRHDRVHLVAVSAGVWGVMTMLTGAAQSFPHLLLARIGVGVGEAGYLPASHAIISALYRAGERATALATMSAGVNVGIFLAFLVGGVVSQFYGWRTAFVMAGLLTVATALIFRLTVRDSGRNDTVEATATGSREALRTTIALIFRDPVLLHVTIAATLTSTVSYGALTWLPSFLVRSHGLGIAEAGIYLSVILGIGGAFGTWLGGYASDRLGARDLRWSLWFVAAAYVATKPLVIGFFLAEGTGLALALFVLPGMTAAMFVGPSVATLHERVPVEMRPVASALFLFLTSFIGLGLGPLITGALSQYVFPGSGEGSLRYALIVMQAAGVWGALHFWLAGRRLSPGPTHASRI